MRITLSLWIATVLLGFGIYAVWYGGSAGDSNTDTLPVTTEEAPEEASEEAPAPDTTEEAEASSGNNDEALGDGSDYSSPSEPDTTEEP